MLTKNFLFKDFNKKRKNKKILKYLNELVYSKIEVINSLSHNYKYSYMKKFIKKLNKYKFIRIFGMGGSLWSHAIYDFLKFKINKNFFFISNLKNVENFPKKNFLNLIISKSGNTLETIANSNVYIKKKDKNVFITENKKSILKEIGLKLKSEIIDHNNYIGGRYSVLSEVGMLPSELMGLNSNNLKKLNNLIKNKNFFNSVVSNATNILHL